VTPERVVVNGLSFPEGPRFDAHGRLHVVELAAGTVSRVVEGRREVLATPGGSPNGAAFDTDGQLWVCNNGGNWGANPSTGGRAGLGGLTPAIQVVHPDGSRRVALTEIDGISLASPNDIASDPRGGQWFTDPVWPARDAAGSFAMAASPPGSVCFIDADGAARRCHTGMVFPNGLTLTPDRAELLVGETGTGRILAFRIAGPGRLDEPRVWCDLGPSSFPDGMAFDSAGRLLVASAGTGAVLVATQDGRVDRVPMEDREVTNLCFGGPDGRSLYVTQAGLGRVVVVDWDVPGEPLPGGPSVW
jgi:gluconolactonase